MAGGPNRPDDVALMQSVLNDWCNRHHISPNSKAAVATAIKILDLMQDHTLTRHDLLRELEGLPPSPRGWQPQFQRADA